MAGARGSSVRSQSPSSALPDTDPSVGRPASGSRLLDSDLPQAIDIPTGLGKTSVMALWLIALARGASLPRRLIYVVDRRAVVDQATRFAERLRAKMPDTLAGALGIGRGSERLPISTLRGGFADNRDWLKDPSKPAIVVGTIDMVGSRLLFEGYGVSRRMRPYHAGLLGVDVLVLLDEAHLCPPFEALLRQVAKHRDGKLGPAPGADLRTPPFVSCHCPQRVEITPIFRPIPHFHWNWRIMRSLRCTSASMPVSDSACQS